MDSYSDVWLRPRLYDPRLRRLAQTKVDNRDEVIADHRRIRQAEIISTEEEETRQQGMEEDDEVALEEKRRLIKEKLREEEEEEDEEDEEESEYKIDSEEDMKRKTMVRHILVPKTERKTIAERERLEGEERAREEKARRKLEERKAETRQMLVKDMQKEELTQKNLKMEAAVADVDVDNERRREGSGRGKIPNLLHHQRRSGVFMQRDYHKDAFFQNECDDRAATAGSDDIFRRDFSAATGEDKMDKSIIPEVMQVKHFGRRG
ncbi:microfibril-associated protein, putative [Ricinus communis]|uniref:Microfibril-associated protein, putative n=1 Tax=Ricinus communis TaxID=3988 RepID=B9SI69_RICCO|nr:microfibril-associated protein, putative [Ricinus communis]